MDVTPLIPAGQQVIESYGEGRFRISGRSVTGSVLVFLDRTVSWPVASMADLTAESLAEVVAAGRNGGIELLLIGCGRSMALIPPAIRQAVRSAGVVIEAMDTGAACRTYNLLSAEGRKVAAALIAVA